MTITFENDNDVIVYAFEKVIAYARRTQQVFVAQCIWWLADIIGLEGNLIKHIDILHGRTDVRKEYQTREDSDPIIQTIPKPRVSETPESKEGHQDRILKECEEYLKDSRRLREIAALKATGRTLTGLINPTAISKKHLRKKDRSTRKRAERLADQPEIVNPKTAGIDQAELRRRKKTGECLRCAWPSDRKGYHQVANCRRPIKLDKGTASFPKAPRHSKGKQVHPLFPVETESSGPSSFEESSDDSL
jgi:hypothetical protein